MGEHCDGAGKDMLQQRNEEHEKTSDEIKALLPRIPRMPECSLNPSSVEIRNISPAPSVHNTPAGLPAHNFKMTENYIITAIRAFVIRNDTYPHMNWVTTTHYLHGSSVPHVIDWLRQNNLTLGIKVASQGQFVIFYTEGGNINQSVRIYTNEHNWHGHLVIFRRGENDCNRLVHMRTGDEQNIWNTLRSCVGQLCHHVLFTWPLKL
jgi:hypothetical protein